MSMENLDMDEEEELLSGSDSGEAGRSAPIVKESETVNPLLTPGMDTEPVSIDPTFILNKAFTKVTAVGSSTAMVAIRN
jgi:hypothetical protein